jgi:hypothetical protein
MVAEDRIAAAADRTGGPPVAEALAALVSVRELRARLDAWEPRLIAAARRGGATWAEIAPALGVASRQAAERRFLRLHQSAGDAAGTRDDRVQAVRDRRAGDRAVDAWARTNGAGLRQLAGQVVALTDLGPAAQPSLDRLYAALGDSDAALLPPLLAAAEEHLPPAHGGLADRVAAMGRDTDRVRQDTQDGRDTRDRRAV